MAYPEDGEEPPNRTLSADADSHADPNATGSAPTGAQDTNRKILTESNQTTSKPICEFKKIRIFFNCPGAEDKILEAAGRRLRLTDYKNLDMQPESRRRSVFELQEHFSPSYPNQNVYLLKGYHGMFVRATSASRRKTKKDSVVMREIKDTMSRFRWGIEFSWDTPCGIVTLPDNSVQRQCFAQLKSADYANQYLDIVTQSNSTGDVRCNRLRLVTVC